MMMVSRFDENTFHIVENGKTKLVEKDYFCPSCTGKGCNGCFHSGLSEEGQRQELKQVKIEEEIQEAIIKF